jgi:chromosomal replication initiation ATPase DnaA
MSTDMLDDFTLRVGEEAGCHIGTTRAARRAHIEQAIALVFGVDDAALACASRGRAEVAHARQAAMYVSHVAGQLTLTEVGSLFERDRTTVSHACAAVEDRRDNPTFDRAIAALELVVPALLSPRRACLPA